MNAIKLLLAFLRLGVGEGEIDQKEEEQKDEPAPDLDVDLDADAGDDDKKADDDRPTAEQFEAARAAEKSERERADRFERELADARRQRPASHQDEMTRREEQELADEKTPELRRWQIQANRTLRAGRTESQMALAQAHDVSDRTAFRAIEAKKPALFKKYEAEVEKTLATIRQNGGNTTREDVFKYLIGRDALDDKFTRKKAAAEKKDDKPDVKRGKLPGARSDVSGKSGQTEHQKRIARLENQPI